MYNMEPHFETLFQSVVLLFYVGKYIFDIY